MILWINGNVLDLINAGALLSYHAHAQSLSMCLQHKQIAPVQIVHNQRFLFIPQQKERIARSVGDAVSSQLLNEETLRAAVLSEESLRLVREKE